MIVGFALVLGLGLRLRLLEELLLTLPLMLEGCAWRIVLVVVVVVVHDELIVL